MKRIFLAIITAAAVMLGAGSVFGQTSITITNGNFDARTGFGAATPLLLSLDSWNKTNGDNNVYIVFGGVGSHSVSNEAALCDNSQIWQVTDHVITLGETYTLTWWDRDRISTVSSFKPLDVTASLRGADGSIIGASSVISTNVISTNWTQRTLQWTVGAGDPLIGQNLRVQFAAANVAIIYDQTSIDDVQLTFIPEPSALTLVGFGLFGAWVLGRRRRG